MKQHRRPIAPLIACVALALIAGGCGKRGGPPQRPPMSVKTAAAVEMDTPVIIKAFGTTEAQQIVDVVPQVSGKLLERFIEDGAVVTIGQPLFLIDPSDYAARVKQMEGAVAAARANLELSKSTVERNQPLLPKQLISQEDFDTIRAKADAAQADLQAGEAALEQAQLSLSRCMITSSVAGVCSQHYLDNGNLVTAGLTKLLNIRNYDPMRVNCSVSEEYLSAIRKAMAEGNVPIEVTPRGDTNSYRGTLDFMDNAVNPLTGTILLRGQVPNSELKLWAQQFVEVSVYCSIIHGAVMVPEGAIQYGKQGPYLFVASKENMAELRPVMTGTRYNDLIQIVRGVAPGEEVVVLGQLMLYPGASVVDLSKLPPAAGGKPGDSPPSGGK
jgi:membrane fusion protein, multidrug efflux system